MQSFRLRPFSFTACMAALCLAPSISAETLHDAVNRACNLHPEVSTARLLVMEAEQRVKETRSSIFPRLDGTAEAGLTDDFDPDDTSLDNGRPLSGQLTLDQPLYLGGRARAAIKGAKSEVRAQKYRSIRQILDVQLTAIEAYINLSRAIDVLGVRQKNIQALETRKNEAERRYALGAGTQTDVLQAVARIERGQAEIMNAWQDIRREEANFIEATGTAQTGELEFPRLPIMPNSLNDAIIKADQVNPDIRAAQALIDVATSNVRGIQKTFDPELRLIGQASMQRDTVFNGFDRDEASLRLRMSVPLFDGGRGRAAEKRSLYARNRTFYDRNLSIQRTREAISTAWTQYETNNNLVTINKNLADVARRAVTAVRKEVEAGFRPNLDILDAQQELLEAELSYTASRYDAVLAAYLVKGQIGDLEVGAFERCRRLQPDITLKPKRKIWEQDLGFGIKIVSPYKRVKRGPRGK